jgi:hypothetical protein
MPTLKYYLANNRSFHDKENHNMDQLMSTGCFQRTKLSVIHLHCTVNFYDTEVISGLLLI